MQTSDALGAANVHLGPRAVTLIVLLHKHVGVSLEKIATLLRDRFGLRVTPGGLVQTLHRAARVAAPAYGALCTQIRGSPVVSPDETGWRICSAGVARSAPTIRGAPGRAACRSSSPTPWRSAIGVALLEAFQPPHEVALATLDDLEANPECPAERPALLAGLRALRFDPAATVAGPLAACAEPYYAEIQNEQVRFGAGCARASAMASVPLLCDGSTEWSEPYVLRFLLTKSRGTWTIGEVVQIDAER